MKKYDANNDRIITREELLTRLRADFALADTAKTGCLGDVQVLAINQQRIAEDQSTATPLQDWNQDGCVNFQEFATAPVSLFDQFDRDGDGRITALELEPPGAGRAAPGEAASGADGRGRPWRARRPGWTRLPTALIRRCEKPFLTWVGGSPTSAPFA